MRNVSQGYIDEMLTGNRVITSAIGLRDNLLRFQDQVINDSTVIEGCTSFDSATNGTKILRIAVKFDALWAQNVDPANWTEAWHNLGITVKSGSAASVFGNTIAYQGADGLLHVGTLSNYVFTQSWSKTLPVGFTTVSVALVAAAELYIYDMTGLIAYVSQSTNKVWPGKVYDDYDIRPFDAERYMGVDYIYFTDNTDKRTLTMSRSGDAWSEVQPVIPLDVVDDTSMLRLAKASTINGRIFVTGVLYRTEGPRMHIYSIGPDQYTMGRDLFISDSRVDVETVDIGNETYVEVPVWGGKLHLIGGKVWFVGLYLASVADATEIVGYSTYVAVEDGALNNIRLSQVSLDPDQLSFDLPASFSNAKLKPGNLLELRMGCNGLFAFMGTYEIDMIVDSSEAEGQSKSVICRSAAMRRLSQWNSDASYDFWGQARQACNPVKLDQMVRTAGQWGADDNGDLILEDFNLHGIMYSVERPARGSIVKGEFIYQNDPTGMFTPKFGLLLNYYYESTSEAAERLEKQTSQLLLTDRGHTAIAAIYSPTEYNGAPGVSIYGIVDWDIANNYTPWLKLQSYSLTIPADEYHWLALEFHDGAMRLLHRADSNTNWTVLGSFRYNNGAYSPWPTGNIGRAGLYMNNITPNSGTGGFDAESSIIPVGTNYGFTAPDVVIVDSEKISFSGKSDNRMGLLNQQYVEGYTVQGAEDHWDNPYKGPFDGEEIYLDGVGEPRAHDYYNNLALVIVDGPGKGSSFKITDYDYTAPAQWIPTREYILPDQWTDHIGDLAHGYWDAPRYKRVFVDRDPTGIVGKGSVFSMTPCLFIGTRGYGGTEVSSHDGSARVSVYRDQRVACERFEYYSTDPEYSFEDMTWELARKAGVLNVVGEKRQYGTLNFSHGGFDLNTDLAGAETRNGGILRFVLNSGTAGVAFVSGSVGNFRAGSIVTVSPSTINLYKIAFDTGVPYLAESIPLGYTYSGQIKISGSKGYISVYINNRLAWTFNAPVGAIVGYVSNGAASIFADWQELDLRVDNFVAAAGQRGVDLLHELIGEKHIYAQDNNEGNLRLFRNRATVSATPYTLAVSEGTIESELDFFTRIRMEGADVAEVTDYDLMRQYGNIFALANSQELDSQGQMQNEVNWLLSEANSKRNTTPLMGAADPRVEPQDEILVSTPKGTRTLIVDRITFSMQSEPGDAVFDMEIDARE